MATGLGSYWEINIFTNISKVTAKAMCCVISVCCRGLGISVEKLSVVVVVVVVVYFILSRLLYLAFSANLGLPCMPHPGMGPLV